LSTAADCVRNWSVPGALVIGDAAHTMSPVGGQGINIALRDAVVAANHLVPVLQGGTDPVALDAAAALIGVERMSEITQVQMLQARPPKIIFGSPRRANVLLSLARVIRFAPVRAMVVRFVRPMFGGVSDVELRV
jgi:2-polyprenyl-6-methoxyphenol hydroxylase-like FAD-dependent oxidoreductase